MRIDIYSFSYHLSGIPADESGHGGGFVFDCRILPNPGREERFRDRNGLDPEVRDYLERHDAVHAFLEHVRALLSTAAEAHTARNFVHLHVAFGCTGGRHRSVYCAEAVASYLRDAGYDVVVTHREIGGE